MKTKPLSETPMNILFTIIDDNLSNKTIEMYKNHLIPIHFAIHGLGMASSEILDYLGIGEVKKNIIMSVIPEVLVKQIFSALSEELNLQKPGTGIAFTIPVSSMSSFLSKICVQNIPDTTKEREEKREMQEYQYELIFTIVTKGCAEQVMKAAKAVGAKGGTLIHGKGLGSEEAEKFLGITIQPEKDIILILAPKEEKKIILENVTKEVGLSTNGKGICFSLPVSHALGLVNDLLD